MTKIRFSFLSLKADEVFPNRLSGRASLWLKLRGLTGTSSWPFPALPDHLQICTYWVLNPWPFVSCEESDLRLDNLAVVFLITYWTQKSRAEERRGKLFLACTRRGAKAIYFHVSNPDKRNRFPPSVNGIGLSEWGSLTVATNFCIYSPLGNVFQS